MKRILCVVFALLMCVSVLFTGCNGNDDTPKGGVVDVSGEQDKEVIFLESDNKIVEVEGETVAETRLGKEAEIFIKGKYCIDGTIYTDGQALPVLLSIDGKNIQFAVNYSGIYFSILVLDGVTYMILPAEKQYTKLSDTLIGAMGLDDFSMEELQMTLNEEDTEASISQFAVTINGENGLCNVYTFDDTIVKLYSIGERLIQIESFDQNENMSMQIDVESITDQIPADQLTLKGLTEASGTSFLKGLANMVS